MPLEVGPDISGNAGLKGTKKSAGVDCRRPEGVSLSGCSTGMLCVRWRGESRSVGVGGLECC